MARLRSVSQEQPSPCAVTAAPHPGPENFSSVWFPPALASSSGHLLPLRLVDVHPPWVPAAHLPARPSPAKRKSVHTMVIRGLSGVNGAHVQGSSQTLSSRAPPPVLCNENGETLHPWSVESTVFSTQHLRHILLLWVVTGIAVSGYELSWGCTELRVSGLPPQDSWSLPCTVTLSPAIPVSGAPPSTWGWTQGSRVLISTSHGKCVTSGQETGLKYMKPEGGLWKILPIIKYVRL